MPDELTPEQLNSINNRTFAGTELEERLRRGIAALDGSEDADQRAHRLASRECPRCWYLRGPTMSGQAFWEYTCWICKEKRMHPNTGTPRYCSECCDKFQLCGDCGGTIDCKPRRTGKPRKK